MSTPEELEWEAEYERAIEGLEGLMQAQVDLECYVCGLSIHVGDPIDLGAHGWVHPVCAVEYHDALDAERAHDMRREDF